MNAPSPSAPHGSGFISTRDVLFVLFYKKKQFAGLFLCVLLTALAYILVTDPIYMASGKLMVKPQTEKPVVFGTDEPRGFSMTEVSAKDINTVIFLLTSNDVLEPVVRAFPSTSDKTSETQNANEPSLTGYMKEGMRTVVGHKPLSEADKIKVAMDSLRGQLSIEPLTPSNLIQVSLKGKDPQRIATIINAIFDAYVTKHIAVNSVQGSQAFFDEQTQRFREEYDAAHQQLTAMKKQWDIVSINEQMSNNLDIIKHLQLQQAETRTELETLRSRLQRYSTVFKDGYFIGLPESHFSNRKTMEELESQVVRLRAEYEKARDTYRPDAAPLIVLRERYQRAERQLQAQIEGLIESTRLEADTLEDTLVEIGKQITAMQEKNAFLADKQNMLRQLEFEVEQKQANYKLYLERQEEARINEEKNRRNFANVVVASPAAPPATAWFPRMSVVLPVSFVMALMLACIGAIVAYLMDHQIKLPQDLERYTGIRFLGSIDALHQR